MKASVFAVVSETTGKIFGEYIKFGDEEEKQNGLSFAIVQQDDNYALNVKDLPVLFEDKVLLSSKPEDIEKFRILQRSNSTRIFTTEKSINKYDLVLCVESEKYLKEINDEVMIF